MSNAINVLHVEDDQLDAEILGNLLTTGQSRQPVSIDCVDSLSAALKKIQNNFYHAILLDLTLRDISGIDNLRALRNQTPQTPIIVLSGSDDEELALRSIEEGAQEYLIKGNTDRKIINLALHSSMRRKAAEQELYRRANYDGLTELPNRILFIEHVHAAIRKATRIERMVGVMFIDLDCFKNVNDQYGHEAGNSVLKDVAARLKHCLRDTDVIARYGGDEFLVLIEDDASHVAKTGIVKAVGNIVTKILEQFNAPFSYNGQDIEVTASVGIAVFPSSGETSAQLIEQADTAMYAAKKAGGNGFRFAVLGKDNSFSA